MNILLFNNNFLPKIDGVIFRIQMFLDIIDRDYPNINITLMTPNTNSITKYKRFDIIHISSEKLPEFMGGNNNNEIFTTKLSEADTVKDFIYNYCNENKIDIIHIYQGDISIGGFIRAGKKLNIPVIISWHTNIFKYLECYGYDKNIIDIYKNIYLLNCFSYADHYMTVSESCKKELIEEHIINHEIEVLPFLIDTKLFYPTIKNNYNPINKNNITILFVGRVTKEKNIDELIELCNKLKDNINFNVIICGEGLYIDELKLKTLNITNCNFYFMGKVKREDLYIYYNSADIYINPSFTETMGFTTLEAMACKLLVVGRNASGTMDIIKHKYNGYLYNNIDELVDIIKYIINNNNDIIINNAYEYVIQYSVEKYTNYLLNSYVKVINKKQNYTRLDKRISLKIYNIMLFILKFF
jgi:1,2-diacylglycerol 3-alpha-glucosyltransferase